MINALLSTIQGILSYSIPTSSLAKRLLATNAYLLFFLNRGTSTEFSLGDDQIQHCVSSFWSQWPTVETSTTGGICCLKSQFYSLLAVLNVLLYIIRGWAVALCCTQRAVYVLIIPLFIFSFTESSSLFQKYFLENWLYICNAIWESILSGVGTRMWRITRVWMWSGVNFLPLYHSYSSDIVFHILSELYLALELFLAFMWWHFEK